MAELKAGAQALIIGCVSNPVNIGKGCTLLELLPSGGAATNPNTGALFANGSPYDGWLVLCDTLEAPMIDESGPSVEKGWSLVRPMHLMPLDDPDAKYEDTKMVVSDTMATALISREEINHE